MTDAMTDEEMIALRDQLRERKAQDTTIAPPPPKKSKVAQRHIHYSIRPEPIKQEPLPAYTPEQIKQFHDAEVRRCSAKIAGDNSIYAGIRLLDKANKQTSILKALCGSLSAPKNLVLLTGAPGCGKTFAAIGYLAELKIHQASFVNAYEMSMMIIRRDFDQLDQYTTCKALILDDLGMEPDGFKGADFLSHLDYLINQRYIHQRTTVITTNLTLDSLKSRYTERFASRFRESGMVIQSTDEDLRG